MADDKETAELKKRQEETEKILKKLGISLKSFDEEVLDAQEHFQETMAKLTDVTVSGLVKSFMSAAKQAMATSDAFAMATAVMHSNVDMIGSAFQVGSKSMVDAGKSMMTSGTKGGTAMLIFGQAVGAAASALVELAHAGIDFLLAQTKQMIAGFQQMNSVGALYSDGMSGMVNTALRAGMTIEQFGKAVAASKDKLASLGVGMGEGSKKLAGAMDAGGSRARQAMFGFGMTMEEQADAYATVMQQMAGPNKKLNASNSEVAEQTMKYVENLKILQDITGEDVKAKQEKIRQENDTLAMQQKMAAMDPKKRAALEQAMLGMTETQRRALREQMIYGTVISQDLNVAAATNAGIRQGQQDTYNAYKDGSLDAEKMRDIQSKNREATAKDAQANQALAMSNSEAAKGASAAQLEQWQYTAGFTDEAKKAAEQAAKDAKEGKGGGADLMEAQQKFATDMQAIANKHLPAFKQALLDTVEQMNKTVDFAAGWGGKLASMLSGWTGMIGSVLLSIAGGVVPAMIANSGLKKKVAETVADSVEKTAEDVVTKKRFGLGKGPGDLVSTTGERRSLMKKVSGGGVGGALSEIEEVAGKGGAAGGGISATLKGLAEGLAAFANPATALGLGAVTLALIGAGTALRIAAPAFESIGKAIGTVVESIGTGIANMAPGIEAFGHMIGDIVTSVGTGIANMASGIEAFGHMIGDIVTSIGTAASALIDSIASGFVKLSNDVDPLKLLAIAPGIGAIGFALLPFGVGGALASLAGSGGFANLVDDIQRFESLNPDKLTAVAGALQKLKDSIPSAADLLKIAAVEAVQSTFGSKDKGESDNGKPVAAGTSREDLLEKIVKIQDQQLSNQKDMIKYLRDNVNASEKIFKAVS